MNKAWLNNLWEEGTKADIFEELKKSVVREAELKDQLDDLRYEMMEEY